MSSFMRSCKVLFLILMCNISLQGQSLNFETPVRLSGLINTDAEESFPLLSHDGQHLFFIRFLYPANAGGKVSGHDIWVAEWKEKQWASPVNSFIPVNNKDNNSIIGMSKDGKTIYLMKGQPGKAVQGFYFSRRLNGSWTKPELVSIPGLDHTGSIQFYVSPDFDVVFIAMNSRESRGEEDLYVSVNNGNGNWSMPKNLGNTINTKGFEIAPFLSQDKRRLYFTSSGHPGKGDGDIFVSERLYDSWEVWSSPVNLGDSVNSEKFDGYLSCYGDSICYFASNRGNTLADLYSVKIKTRTREDDQREIQRLLAESQTLLENVKKETGSIEISKPKPAYVFYQDNATEMLSSSDAVITIFLNYLKRYPNSNLVIQYDVSVQGDEFKSLITDRIDKLKKRFVKEGVNEKRIRSAVFKTELGSARLKQNSFQLMIAE